MKRRRYTPKVIIFILLAPLLLAVIVAYDIQQLMIYLRMNN